MEKNLKKRVICFVIFTFYLYLSPQVNAQSAADWYTVGANPQRTNWTPAEVTGSLHLEWYRPIEAYIDQKVQVIAANNLLYISTARGLLAFRADNGDLAWRWNSELPLGNSPTVDVSNAVLYVAGFDRKLHAINASTGQHLWEYSGATAGYATNPLLVEGKVILGNRDGGLYAVGAQGGTQTGQLIWKYQTTGPINQSAAYKDGVVYFVSDDQYAYAVRASNGTLEWKSENKLPGDGFQSYWPVIFRDKVIFSSANRYSGNTSLNSGLGMLRTEAVWPENVEGTLAGNEVPAETWSHGYPLIDAHRMTEIYEENTTDNPANDANPEDHKPWRRTLIVLNQADGKEFTFDSDADGFKEYMPVVYWHTNSGTMFPGIVGPDNIFYHNNAFRCCSDAKGKTYGWNPDRPGILSMTGSASLTNLAGGWAAMAEPQILSGGGRVIYRSLCCNRVADWWSIDANPRRSGTLYSYSLYDQAPGFDEMWNTSAQAISNHIGWYKGTLNTGNLYDTTVGMYHSHGIQNPLVPYQGRIYIHRGNALIAYGTGTARGKLPSVPVVSVLTPVNVPSTAELTQRLESEVTKILDAGNLRPGYAVTFVGNYGELADYFLNPGDTLSALSLAYPYLSASVKTRVANYLNQQFVPTYLGTTMYIRLGWNEGAAREWMPLPPDIGSRLANFPKGESGPGRQLWIHPWISIYALYKYAQNVSGANISQAYQLAKTAITHTSQYRPPASAETATFSDDPFVHNAIITGYFGFLKLQELAGATTQDAALRQSVQAELNRLLTLRYQLFNQDSPWADRGINYKKTLDIARNFMYLSPELAADMRNNILSKVDAALTEYDYVAPYWFVGKYDDTCCEYGTQNLYSLPALIQAKAWIQNKSREELYKYLDSPSFARGDLFYIQNLIATIQAPSNGSPPTLTPPLVPSSPTPPLSGGKSGDANADGKVDGLDYVIWRNHYNQQATGAGSGDFNNNGFVDGLDYVIWRNNYNL